MQTTFRSQLLHQAREHRLHLLQLEVRVEVFVQNNVAVALAREGAGDTSKLARRLLPVPAEQPQRTH